MRKAGAPLKAVTFKLDLPLIEGMHEYREREGVALTEQVKRALRVWLSERGINVSEPAARPRGRRGR